MKLKRLIPVILLISILLFPAVSVLASDISEARYYGIIRVSNNSTATTNVATTCNISTQNLIDGDYLNASANNCVIRTSSGGDVLFQPSVNSSYFWSIWEESIGANSYDTDILYTANSTGGLIAYFPGAAGMETADNDTFLELGDNFTIEQSGWIDTTAGADKNLVYKTEAIKVAVSDTVSGNITAFLLAPDLEEFSSTSDGWLRCADAVYNTAWTAVAATTREDGAASVTTGQNIGFQLYKAFFFFDTSAIPDTAVIASATLKLYGQTDQSATDFLITIQNGQPTYPHDPMVDNDYSKAHYSGDGGSLTTNGLDLGGYNDIELNAGALAWIDLTGTTKLTVRSDREIAGTQPTGAEYVAFHSTEAAGTDKDPQLVVEYYLATVTATGVASGNHTVKITGELTLDFDGTSDVIVIPDAPQQAGFAEMSLEIRGRIDGAGGSGSQVLTMKEGTAANDAYSLQIVYASKLFSAKWIGVDASATHTSTDNFTLGEWFYAVSTYDGANIKFYLDGDYDGATPLVGGVVKSPSVDLYLGCYYDSINSDLHGSIVEVKIYSRILTPEEIVERSNGYYADESDLEAHYHINEGTGTNIVDSTAYGNDGTATGTSWDNEELKLYIDDEFCDIDVLSTVPNTSANWTACKNDSFMWIDSHIIEIGGVERQNIEWEYAEVFTDLSGNGQDATPSFRLASSDADVSAELLSFYPVAEARAPTYVLEETTDFISAPYLTGNLAVSPGDFTITPDTSGGFPLAGFIADVAGATATPAQLPLVTIAMFIVLTASLCTGYYLRKYGRGSLLVKMMITAGFMGIFVAIGNFGIDMWMIYFYLGIAIAMGFGSKAISM